MSVRPLQKTLARLLPLVAALGLLSGCSPPPPSPGETPQAAALEGDALRARLDEELEAALQDRLLSLKDHRAWQILHGALAYQREFPVKHGDKLVSAVDHILGGGKMRGWTVEPIPGADGGRPGLRALLEEGSKAGQGHADQWLAILSQCGLPETHTVKLNGAQYTLGDLVRQVQMDVPRNLQREYSWTLIGLTAYRPTDATWTASDGKTWSIEKLVQIEAEQELNTSACGGTHRLIGMAMALNRHRKAGGEVTGGWADAQKVIDQAVVDARRLQNPDGSFSTAYFERAGASPDLAQNLGTSGHILEFLAIALPKERLQEPWVRRAVDHMCRIFRKTRSIPLECGKLYHAAHGLVLYRERVFGPRTYEGLPPAETPPAGPAAATAKKS